MTTPQNLSGWEINNENQHKISIIAYSADHGTIDKPSMDAHTCTSKCYNYLVTVSERCLE